MRISQGLLAGVALLAFTQAAGAAQGDWQVRVRVLAVLPDPGGTLTIGGMNIPGHFQVSQSVIPEIDGTYFFTDHWGAELIAGITKHSAHHTTAGNLGSSWLLPPTLTAQYHFDPEGTIRPYLGAGVNYTIFYNSKSPLPPVSYRDSFGWVLQAGVDIPFGDNGYFFNADVKKLFLSTDVRAAGGLARASVDLDPWIIGAGVGIRF